MHNFNFLKTKILPFLKGLFKFLFLKDLIYDVARLGGAFVGGGFQQLSRTTIRLRSACCFDIN